LWDAKTSTFAGMLTASDYLNVVQYYWQFPDLLPQIDQFRLDKLRDIERAIGVSPIETVSTHPLTSLYEACRRMLASRARRIPLVDVDDETKREMVISVITQYRILKFMTINVPQTQMLKKPLRELNIGTYENLVTCSMDTPVIDVIHQLVQRSISCVPILDHEGTVLNVFEAVDVIALIKGGDYDSLTISVGMALNQRPEVRPTAGKVSLPTHPFLLFPPPPPAAPPDFKSLTRHISRISRASTPARPTTACTPSSRRSASPACTASSSSTTPRSSRACSRSATSSTTR
jgi:CBS domain-containing protein